MSNVFHPLLLEKAAQRVHEEQAILKQLRTITP